MKRALLVSVGTVTGLAAVLSYSDGAPAITDLAATAGAVDGVGASPTSASPSEPGPAGTATSPRTSATPTATPKPTRSTSTEPTPSTTAKPTRSASAKPSPTPTRSTSSPKPTSSPTTKPKPTRKPTPTATATPTPTLPNGDFLGPVVTHRYGPVQVGIQVTDGVITRAWAEQAPSGSSTSYTNLAVPRLSAETVGTKTAQIAIVSGATLTSRAWITSLAAAMVQAGI